MSRSFMDVRGREEVLLMGAIFLSTGMGIGRREKLMERGEIHIKAGYVAVRWGAGFRVWLDMVPWNDVGLYKSRYQNRKCDHIEYPHVKIHVHLHSTAALPHPSSTLFNHPSLSFSVPCAKFPPSRTR
jgi:hypothetical protein